MRKSPKIVAGGASVPGMAASATELEQHRAALTGHCYRMLGSASDADDAVQETMVRAWRKWDGFDGRSSVRTWLYRIATNVCIDALTSRARREMPFQSAPEGTVHSDLHTRERSHWLEPIADTAAIPADADPAQAAILRQSIRLAFVAALQTLPPKQRAALLLTEVLDWSADEVAESLETSTASVNSALQRARATVATRDLTNDVTNQPASLTDAQSALVDRYFAAFERYDVAALTSLLREDVILSMPPYTLWLRGPDAVATWLSGRGAGCRGSRLVRLAACGSPAFGQYRNGGRDPFAIIVLDLADDRIAGMTSFLDVDVLFPRFGLPPRLDP